MPDEEWEEESDLDAQLERLRERDVNAFAFAMILAEIEGELDEQGWDQPPRLLAVQRHLDVDLSNLMAYTTVELPTPIRRLNGDEIEKYLIWTAAKMTKSSRLIPDSLFGYILAYEAWMQTGMSQADMDSYQYGDIAKAPDRIEIRTLSGVDTAGINYSLVRQRGYSGRQLMVDGLHDFYGEGRFIDALRMLASVSTPEPPV